MFKLPFKLNFRKRALPETFYTVDIGTHSIKVLAMKDLEELSIIGASKELLEQDIVRAGNIVDIDKVAETLDEALFKASEGLVDDISSVVFGLSNEQTVDLITTVRVTRASSSEITSEELANLTNKIKETANEKAAELYSKRTGNYDEELEIVTSNKVYAKIDNNLTDSLIGQNGNKIELAMYYCYSPKIHIEKLQQLAKLLKINILAITSNHFSIVQTLKELKKSNILDGVLIDIGHDTTDVSVFFGGGIVATSVLEIGAHHFTEQLSKETGYSLIESERKKHEYSFGDLSQEESIKIENGLNSVLDTWLEGLEVVFQTFDGVKTFSPDIYVIGGGSKLPLVSEYLETKPWTKSIPFKDLPKFYKINPTNLSNAKDLIGKVEEKEYINVKCLSTIYKTLKKGQENDDN